MKRACKTMLCLATRAHTDTFRQLGDADPPRAQAEQETYWGSLCEAHLPVINELIQRYRLLTYDYYAYEVSPWDVPVWWIKHAGAGYRAVLLPYRNWDMKPVTIEDGDSPGDPPKIRQFEWTTPAALAATSSDTATAGEFDLLDARSLMNAETTPGRPAALSPRSKQFSLPHCLRSSRRHTRPHTLQLS